MAETVLALNVGSSSLKFALYALGADEPLAPRATGHIDGIGARPRLRIVDADGRAMLSIDRPDQAPASPLAALDEALGWLAREFPRLRPAAVGHRVVMGGVEFNAPVVVDDAVFARLDALSPLAPLHQPACLNGIRAARHRFPKARQVACFDTAFHRAHPFVNDVYALPRRYYDAGVRRFGFHGLSYEYVSGRLREVDPLHAAGRVAIAHLGSGASICALRDGQSVGSTMGFSALDGLPMGTRCGQIDPGVVLWLLQQEGMDATTVTRLLYHESGLKGLSGVSSDMRDLLASDDPQAQRAVDYFVFWTRREIGAMASILGGLDAIVFTGGIGEHAAAIREYVLEGMEWLGVELDRHANRVFAAAPGNPTPGIISSQRSRVRVWVIPTNEELAIARHAAATLAKARSAG